MKRLLLCALVASMALPVLAELQGNGYYRVQNAFTKRYAYLLDNKGSYSMAASTADVGALELHLDTERVLSDPSGVFYIEAAPQGNNFYDIGGQGTSIHSFMNEYLTIYPTRQPFEGKQAYYVYATKSGISKYLGDRREDPTTDKGLASVDCTGEERKWFFEPLTDASDQYFGVLPTIEADGKMYAPFFAHFPFSAKSEGMKVYAVTDIDARGGAIITEISGAVPSSAPVIIECAGAHPSDNRLDIGVQAAAVDGNKLRGVYFNNTTGNHKNLTPFDKETMRVLGVSKDGRLAFVKGDYDYIPRNQAYLQLTDPEQYEVEEFLVLTEDQREEELSKGGDDPDPGTDPDDPNDNPDDPNDNPDDPGDDPDAVSVILMSAKVDVYRLDGRLVVKGITKDEVSSLGKGLYILRGAGLTEKHIVR